MSLSYLIPPHERLMIALSFTQSLTETLHKRIQVSLAGWYFTEYSEWQEQIISLHKYNNKVEKHLSEAIRKTSATVP